MQEIENFKIYKATASFDGKRTVVKLFYPSEEELNYQRFNENLQFGCTVFSELLNKGYSEIATSNNPISPPCGGFMYIFSDGKFLCHRRDKFAPTHKLYHSISSGFPQHISQLYSKEGIFQIALREASEECILITKEEHPKLIVPRDSMDYVLETAKRLKIKLPMKIVDVETLDPIDVLEVYDHSQNIIFKTSANVDFIFESQSVLNALWVRKFPFSSEEILPIDAEFIETKSELLHLNRESYIIDIKEIAKKSFGDPLTNFKVFKTKEIVNGIPKVYSPEYLSPYTGPGGLEVIHPHLWAPDNLLVKCLNVLGVEGYNWVEIEKWKETTIRDHKSLLSHELLKSSRKEE